MLTEEDVKEIKRQELYSAIIALNAILFSTIGLIYSLTWVGLDIRSWGFYLPLVLLGWLIWGGMIWLTQKASENHRNYLIVCNELRLLREELYQLKNKE